MSEFWMDNDAANRVKWFFENLLRHSKGEWAGQPFTLLDWQWNDIVKPLFGWKRPDGTRRYRRAYIEVPKKNGKSALCSGLSLFLLVGDNEPGAEIYTAAADRDQATIIFNESANMVDASPALSKHLEVVRSQKRIVCTKTKSWYKALSAEVNTKEGLNIHGLVFDELHVQKSRDLWDTLTYGGAARRQPLQISITTAGVYDPESIGWEQHEYARGVMDGSIEDDSFFAYIAAADPDDDWQSEETWKKANPSFGVTVKPESFAEAAREAANEPRKLNSFLRYRLNLWTQQTDRWITMDAWEQSSDVEVPPIEEVAEHGVYVGLDLSSTNDLTAAVAVVPVDDGYFAYPMFWCPQRAAAERERRNQNIYRNWIRSGHLRETPGDVVDYKYIRKYLADLNDSVGITELAYDPWNGEQLALDLRDENGIEIVKFGQGYASMNEPSKEFEKLVLSGNLWHGGNPVMRWMANNVAVDSDPAGNIKPSKKSSFEKIDGIVAAIMGIGRGMLTPSVGSDYDTAGCL